MRRIGTGPVLDIEIMIEHRHKNHPVKFKELINTYFSARNSELRRLAFFWLHMLKMKGVVGAEKGYFSEEAYIIILISYLQKHFHLSKAQCGLEEHHKKLLVREMMPNN